jgi:DNA gyrase/topoisomerase IV subunit A
MIRICSSPNKGKIFALKAYEVPVVVQDSRGKSLKGMINLSPESLLHGHNPP